MIPKQGLPGAPVVRAAVGVSLVAIKPLGMTQTVLAKKMGVPIQRVNTLINSKRGVTAETAILLARIFKTSPQFWLGLQMDCDLWDAQRKMARAG